VQAVKAKPFGRCATLTACTERGGPEGGEGDGAATAAALASGRAPAIGL